MNNVGRNNRRSKTSSFRPITDLFEPSRKSEFQAASDLIAFDTPPDGHFSDPAEINKN